MTPFVGISTASCGKKLLRISEHFSESLLHTELGIVQLTQRQVLFFFSLCYFHSLADFSFN